MTATLVETPEVEKVRRSERAAEIYFLARLARIVDNVDDLQPGDDRFDFCFPVRAERLHEVGLQVAELEFEVQEKYGVVITAMPIPTNA